MQEILPYEDRVFVQKIPKALDQVIEEQRRLIELIYPLTIDRESLKNSIVEARKTIDYSGPYAGVKTLERFSSTIKETLSQIEEGLEAVRIGNQELDHMLSDIKSMLAKIAAEIDDNE